MLSRPTQKYKMQAISILALLLGMGAVSGAASAAIGVSNAPATTHNPARPLTTDAYLAFVPEGSAPANGGTVNVGDRFVLGLWLNSGSSAPPNGPTAQQSYLTFTYDLIKNARVDEIGTDCVLTNTVTPDRSTFDIPLQNEICNGTGPNGDQSCIFRQVAVGPGSIAYVSGGLSNCRDIGCGGYFRVAQVGLCAVAPGRAVLHWQFRPPAPLTRDTEIVTYNGDLVHNPSLFTDYVINIAGATYTPTPTLTPGSPTSTPTRTRTSTPTPIPIRDAFMVFVPLGSAPANGGTALVGDRIILELWLNAGSNYVNSQQSYLTYTYGLLQNARVDQIVTGCVLTNSVTADLTIFDAQAQNEVCNGPGTCTFRGRAVEAGSLAYASVASTSSCPYACDGYLRVARIGLCAIAQGSATLHWQFSPPAPALRGSDILAPVAEPVQNPALYADYVINIAVPTSTPTGTPTGLMVGHVTWQGRPPQPNARQQVPISMSLALGSTQVNYTGIATDPNGFFTVTVGSVPSGNYTWRVKGYDRWWGGPGFLANSGTVSLVGAPITRLEMNLMRAGDTNNDNIANIVDFNILKAMFGSACNPCQDPRPDFNSDSTVSVLDFNLLKINFGAGGARPISR